MSESRPGCRLVCLRVEQLEDRLAPSVSLLAAPVHLASVNHGQASVNQPAISHGAILDQVFASGVLSAAPLPVNNPNPALVLASLSSLSAQPTMTNAIPVVLPSVPASLPQVVGVGGAHFSEEQVTESEIVTRVSFWQAPADKPVSIAPLTPAKMDLTHTVEQGTPAAPEPKLMMDPAPIRSSSPKAPPRLLGQIQPEIKDCQYLYAGVVSQHWALVCLFLLLMLSRSGQGLRRLRGRSINRWKAPGGRLAWPDHERRFTVPRAPPGDDKKEKRQTAMSAFFFCGSVQSGDGRRTPKMVTEPPPASPFPAAAA